MGRNAKNGWLMDFAVIAVIGSALYLIIGTIISTATGHSLTILFHFMPRRIFFIITAISYAGGAVIYRHRPKGW